MSFPDIVTNGKYYNPANSRYAPDSVVICDRCKKRDLLACIGYLDQDLCLPCADQVIVIMERNRIQPPITQMDSNRFEILTRMRSGRYDDQNTMTYMMSNRFRESINYDKITGVTEDMANISIEPFDGQRINSNDPIVLIGKRNSGASRLK
jgi:hypothetical protein